MIIRIVRHEKNYTLISNSLFEDARISFKAKGVLGYLLSRKEGWVVQVTDLVNRGTDGRDSIYSALKELRLAGYAKLKTIRKRGMIVSKEWVIREVSLVTGFPDRTSRNRENPGTSNNGSINNNGSKVAFPRHRFDLSPPSPNGGFPDTAAGKLCKTYAQFLTDNHLLPQKTYRGRIITIRPVVSNWLAASRELLSRVDPDDVEETLQWYFENHRDPYVKTHRSFVLFCINFDTVQKAMFRQQKRRPDDEDTYAGERKLKDLR